MIWWTFLTDLSPEITRLPGPESPPGWYSHGAILVIGILCVAFGFVVRGFFDE